MANAGGGNIIVGVHERTDVEGFPGALTGLEGGDALSQMWENISKGCIDPRIPGFFTKLIPLSGGRSAIIVYIPPSLRKPHLVIIEKHRGFYIRHGKDSVPDECGWNSPRRSFDQGGAGLRFNDLEKARHLQFCLSRTRPSRQNGVPSAVSC